MSERLPSLAEMAALFAARAAIEQDGGAANGAAAKLAKIEDWLPGATGAAKSAQAEAAGSAPEEKESLSVSEEARRRAAVELELEAARREIEELRRQHQQEIRHRQDAEETLTRQRTRVQELEGQRGKLLADIARLEDDLRKTENARAHIESQFEQLKLSRQSATVETVRQTERVNALESELAALRAALEAAEKQQHATAAVATARVAAADAQTEGAAFAALWADLAKAHPQIFVETHAPPRETFARVGLLLSDLLHGAVELEGHVRQMLHDLRQVDVPEDKLTKFHLLLTRNPRLADTLRDFLLTGRQKGNFQQLLQTLLSWSRGFSVGMYKLVVLSPAILQEEMNPRGWPVKGLISMDAALGKYYKDKASRELPEKIGTILRRRAADMSYEEYAALLKRR